MKKVRVVKRAGSSRRKKKIVVKRSDESSPVVQPGCDEESQEPVTDNPPVTGGGGGEEEIDRSKDELEVASHCDVTDTCTPTSTEAKREKSSCEDTTASITTSAVDLDLQPFHEPERSEACDEPNALQQEIADQHLNSNVQVRLDDWQVPSQSDVAMTSAPTEAAADLHDATTPEQSDSAVDQLSPASSGTCVETAAESELESSIFTTTDEKEVLDGNAGQHEGLFRVSILYLSTDNHVFPKPGFLTRGHRPPLGPTSRGLH